MHIRTMAQRIPRSLFVSDIVYGSWHHPEQLVMVFVTMYARRNPTERKRQCLQCRNAPSYYLLLLSRKYNSCLRMAGLISLKQGQCTSSAISAELRALPSTVELSLFSFYFLTHASTVYTTSLTPLDLTRAIGSLLQYEKMDIPTGHVRAPPPTKPPLNIRYANCFVHASTLVFLFHNYVTGF